MTPQERRLWQYLRGRGLGGFKFRRQVPIGPFIVDFLCPQAKLIVEVDGDSHDARLDYDRRRTAYLNDRGYRLIRVSNAEVRTNLEGVLHGILEALRNPLT